jgi:hypothetical protein
MLQPQDQPSPLEIPEPFNNSAAHTYLWRDLYRVAIFERERAMLPARIREAERALIEREHELCMNQQSSAERESVITALNCLHALRTCMKATSRT